MAEARRAFVIRFAFSSDDGPPALLDMLSELGDRVCNRRGIDFKGAGNASEMTLTFSRERPPLDEAERDLVAEWLRARPEVSRLEVSALAIVDA